MIYVTGILGQYNKIWNVSYICVIIYTDSSCCVVNNCDNYLF